MASTSACSRGASTGRSSPFPEVLHESRSGLQHGSAGRSHDPGLAIATFRKLHPDLYELSAQAFDAGPAGSISHYLRLGEFLTEWNNGLGCSPVEALASGQREQVERELAERAGLYEDED